MLVANIPRQVRFLVAMKSMKRWVIGLLSRLAGGIPVIRQDDLATPGEGRVRISHHHHRNAIVNSHVCSTPASQQHPAGATFEMETGHLKETAEQKEGDQRGEYARDKENDGDARCARETQQPPPFRLPNAEGSTATTVALHKSDGRKAAPTRAATSAASECSIVADVKGREKQAETTAQQQPVTSTTCAVTTEGRRPAIQDAEDVDSEKGISSWWRAVRSPAQRARRISDAAAASVAAAADKIAEFEGDSAVPSADSGPATGSRREAQGREKGMSAADCAVSGQQQLERPEGDWRPATGTTGSGPSLPTGVQPGLPLLSIFGEKTHFVRDCPAGCKLLIEKQHFAVVKVISDTHLLATAVETETLPPRLRRSISERGARPPATAGEGGVVVSARGRPDAAATPSNAAARDNSLCDSAGRRGRAAERIFVGSGRSSSGEREDRVRRNLLCTDVRSSGSSSKGRSKSAVPSDGSHAFPYDGATPLPPSDSVVFNCLKNGTPGSAGVPGNTLTTERNKQEKGAEHMVTAAAELQQEGENIRTHNTVLRLEVPAAAICPEQASAAPHDDSKRSLARERTTTESGKKQSLFYEGSSPLSCPDTQQSTDTVGTTGDSSNSSSDSSYNPVTEKMFTGKGLQRRDSEAEKAVEAPTHEREEQIEEKKEQTEETERRQQLPAREGLRRRRGREAATTIDTLAATTSSMDTLQTPSAIPGERSFGGSRRRVFSPLASKQQTQARRYCSEGHHLHTHAHNYKPYKILPRVDQRKVYEEVSRSLIDGDCIGIFPEGGSHDRTTLLPLKAGVAIMALQGLAAGAEDVMIVPVGLTYHNPHKTQSRATVCIGEPIPISRELAAEYERDRRAATAQILTDVEKGLRSCIITAQDHETIMLIKLSCSLYPPERLRLSPEKYFNLNQLLSKLFWRCAEEPELLKLRQGLVQYQGSLARAGIPDHDVWMLKQSTAGASLYFAEKLIALAYSIAFGVPLLPLWGPLRVLARFLAESHRAQALAASSVKVKGMDVVASYKVIVLLVCVPLFNILYGALVGFFFLDTWKETLFTILICVCLLPMSYYISMRRAERILPLMRQIRTLIMVLVGKVNVWRENERELVTQRTEMQLCVRETLFHLGPRTSPTFTDELYAIVPKAVLNADNKRLVQKKEDFAPLQMKYLLNNADEIL